MSDLKEVITKLWSINRRNHDDTLTRKELHDDTIELVEMLSSLESPKVAMPEEMSDVKYIIIDSSDNHDDIAFKYNNESDVLSHLELLNYAEFLKVYEVKKVCKYAKNATK